MIIILDLSAILFVVHLDNHERIHPAEQVLSISQLLSLYNSHHQLGLGLGLGLRSYDVILGLLLDSLTVI